VAFEELPKVFQDVFEFGHQHYATDIYVREGVPVFFKLIGISGTAMRVVADYYRNIGEGLSQEELREKQKEIPATLKTKVVKGDINEFLEKLKIDTALREEIDTAFTLTKGDRFYGRFRLNVANADGTVVLSMRRLYSYVPDPFEDLRLPDVISEVRDWSSGLVIVTGPTGSGKSTTLAGVMRYLSEDPTKSRVIVTIEKPIEYVFDNRNAFFIQREVGMDTEDFVSGVHNALRQHPDVIYVGESRTPEEIKATLMASETGHLTFTTLHTASAWGVISRIIDVFPPDEQPQIKTILADQLRLVIAQRLVTTVDGAVRAVAEVLYVDDYVRNKIKEKDGPNLKDIREYMKKGEKSCVTLNSVLYKLVTEGVILPETAIKVSYDPKELESLLRRPGYGV